MRKEEQHILQGLSILLFLLLLTNAAHAASFWEIVRNAFTSTQGSLITGKAVSGTTGLSITTANLIPNVTNVTFVPSQSITESGTTVVSISFIATDPDGTGNLNESSASINLTTNEDTTVRFNRTCGNTGTIGTIGINFTCRIGIQYFDKPGNWTIRAGISDISGAWAANETTNLTLLSTLAIVVGPSSLSFPTISTGAENVTAQQAIAVNNTGNQNVTTNNTRVQAFDLVGESQPSYNIPAGNFTVDTVSGAGNPQCGVQSVMSNATAINITNSIVPRGNNTAGNAEQNGKEQLFVCLRRAPLGSSLIGQTYSATGATAWVVSVG